MIENINTASFFPIKSNVDIIKSKNNQCTSERGPDQRSFTSVKFDTKIFSYWCVQQQGHHQRCQRLYWRYFTNCGFGLEMLNYVYFEIRFRYYNKWLNSIFGNGKVDHKQQPNFQVIYRFLDLGGLLHTGLMPTLDGCVCNLPSNFNSVQM